MNAHHAQPYYAPSSVGALMDPAFLRHAVMEANGDRHEETVALATLRWRWRGAIHALHAIAAAFQRHLPVGR
jgi:hypothetical protein